MRLTMEERGPDLREVNEERSIALHRLVGERLREDPALITTALERIDRWLLDGSIHQVYGAAWQQLLRGPLENLLGVLTERGEHARALRQCSPFAGVLDTRSRWRIWRQGRTAG